MSRHVPAIAALLLAGSSLAAQPDGSSADIPDAGGDLAEPANLEEILARRDRYERMTVPVTIEGHGPFRFLVDTGAQATVVTPAVASALQLQPSGQAVLVAMGSTETVQTIALDGLEFANRRFNGLTAPLLEQADVGADGILGLDSLQDLRVLIDFREDRITVADADALGGNAGYEIIVRARRKLGQMIITDARVDGVRTAVIIDTGAQNSTGNMALRRKVRARQEAILLATDVNGAELQSDLAFANTLEIGGLTLAGVPIGYAQSPAFAALGLDDRPALILGMGNLRPFERVAIDFSDQRVLFDLPGTAGYDQLRKRVFFPSRIGSI